MRASVRFIDEHADEQLRYLIKLSQQNSYSWNKPARDQVAAMVLERIGTAFRFHRVVEQTIVGDLHILSNVPPSEKSIYVLDGLLDTKRGKIMLSGNAHGCLIALGRARVGEPPDHTFDGAPEVWMHERLERS